MRRRLDLYLLLAIFSLGAGLVTLASGTSHTVAIAELVLAIICALLNLRRHRGD
jgi:hypothetical protein